MIFKRKKSPPKRHQVQIYLPAAALGSRGQKSGSPTLVMESVFASIEPLTGTELEQARQYYALSSHRIRFFGDPAVLITSKHYILHGTRQFNIGFVGDSELVGYEYSVLCGEAAP